MNILHIISSLGVKSGGMSSCLYALINDIDKYHFDVLSFKLGEGDRLPGPFKENINLLYADKPDNRFGYSSEFKKSVIANNSKVVHIHGLWEYTGYIGVKGARKKNVPYVITPHGMLYPQALNHSATKKKIFLKLFLLKDLQEASAIHATCVEEMEHLRNLQIKAPVAIIPNPVDIPEDRDEKKSSNKRIGYLGRVHPRKNIERLLYAFDLIGENYKDVELVIIGDGDKDYMDFLKKEKERLALERVKFTGFLSGRDKDEAISSLDFLVVPSDFENFGMIIAEALVRKVPVIASKGTPWEDLESYNCGWWIDNDVKSIAQSIKKALSMSEDEKRIMGENGRNLIIEKYSPKVVSFKMEELYTWLLSGGEKPDFVYLD